MELCCGALEKLSRCWTSAKGVARLARRLWRLLASEEEEEEKRKKKKKNLGKKRHGVGRASSLDESTDGRTQNGVTRVPSTMMLNSAERGWTWGVLKPQGPMKPRVMDMPLPIRAGKILRSAFTVRPPSPEVVALVPEGELKSKSQSEPVF